MEKSIKFGELVKEITVACVRRNGLVDAQCPAYRGMDESELAEISKGIDDINTQISRFCEKQRKMEADGGIGVACLFGHDVPDSIRVTLNLLIANAFVDSLRRSVSTVSELAELAVVRDPKGLFEVRDAFAKNGVLRPHVNLNVGRHIGELELPALKEKSLRILLALPLDAAAEFESIESGAQAITELRKWRRL